MSATLTGIDRGVAAITAMEQAITAIAQAIRAMHETVTAAAMDQAPRATRNSASRRKAGQHS